MFTGIVEETGTVVRIVESPTAIQLQVRAKICGSDAQRGDSIAVNGCCLTVVEISEEPNSKVLSFDLLRETWTLTNFAAVKEGSAVNMERALPVNGRLHGHFVTGHIDGIGIIESFEMRGADWYLQVKATEALLRYVVFKGSIAIDGISLTVAEVERDRFSVWIIPHTYQVTALRERSAGERVNLEADLLAKYVEKITLKP